MKARNGFVSNSSSSSFVIVCPKKVFDGYVKKAHPFYRAWIERFYSRNLQVKKFLGEEVIIITDRISSEDGYDLAGYKGELPKDVTDYNEGEEGESPNFDGGEILGNIADALEKFSKDVISIQESC